MIETSLTTKISGFPGVLGSSQPGNVGRGPQVRLIEVDDGVRFEQAECDEPMMSSVSTAEHLEKLMPTKIQVEDGRVKFLESVRFFDSTVIGASEGVVSGEYFVWIRINEKNVRDIQDCEHQHVEDFAHAFALSCVALRDAINGLASKVITSASGDPRAEALRQLAAAVPAHLVPEDITNLAAWTKRATGAYLALAGLSTQRDGYRLGGGPRHDDYPHKVHWWAVREPPEEPDWSPKLVLEPHASPRQTASDVLINFNDAITTDDWRLFAATAPEPEADGGQLDGQDPFDAMLAGLAELSASLTTEPTTPMEADFVETLTTLDNVDGR
jgi:hypothetical protein